MHRNMATLQNSLQTSTEPPTIIAVVTSALPENQTHKSVYNHYPGVNNATTQTLPEDFQLVVITPRKGQKVNSDNGSSTKYTQSLTWNELATNIVLEVVTQQVTKIQGLQPRKDSSSCSHIDGMTWKDIVAMIVETHNNVCTHTGVKLHHNMVCMTSSIADQHDGDMTGSNADVSSTAGKSHLTANVQMIERRTPKDKTTGINLLGGQDGVTSKSKETQLSKCVKPFEVEFNQTVENLPTKQDSNQAVGQNHITNRLRSRRNQTNKTHVVDRSANKASDTAKLVKHTCNSKVHNASETYVCKTCGVTYKNKITLKYHMLGHSGDKTFQCNVCNKSFSRPDALRVHRSQHKPKDFHCSLCPKAYPYRSLLVRHWQYSHFKEDTVHCQYCDKTFQNYYQKNSHEETHTGYRQYICQTCGKGFHQKSSLVTHERCHTGEKPFKCSYCKKGFVSKSHVRRHEKTHICPASKLEKPFKCTKCESAFKWKHQWKDHENRHQGIKPHKCKDCKSAFVAKCDLNRHMKVHSHKDTKGNHQCTYCKATFSVKQKLEKHEVDKHLQFETVQKDNDSKRTVIVVMK